VKLDNLPKKIRHYLTVYILTFCIFWVQGLVSPLAFADATTTPTNSSGSTTAAAAGTDDCPTYYEYASTDDDNFKNHIKAQNQQLYDKSVTDGKSCAKPSEDPVRDERGELIKGRKNKKDDAELLENVALFVENILLLAAAFFSALLVVGCKQFSTAVGAIAAITFIIMEIVNWNKYKEASDKEADYYDSESQDLIDEQIEAFRHAKKETDKAAEGAKARADAATTVGTMWGVAAIIALVEAIASNPPVNYDDSCKDEDSEEEGDADADADVDADADTGGGGDAPQSVEAPSYGNKKVIEMVNVSGFNLKNLMVKIKKFKMPCKKVKGPSTFEFIKGLILPEANAMAQKQWMQGLGLGVAAILAIAVIGIIIKKAGNKLKSKGVTRIILYGIFAGIAFGVMALLKEAQKIYEDQAKEYEKILNKLIEKSTLLAFRAAQTKAEAVKGKGNKNQNISLGNKIDLSSSTEGGSGQSACADTDKEGNPVPTPCDKCAEPGSCQAVFPVNNFGTDIPLEVNSTLTAADNYANQVYSGNANSTAAGEASLQVNGNSNAIRAIQSDLFKSYNDLAKKNGFDQVDFDGEIKKGIKEFRGAVLKGVNNLNSKQRNALASELGLVGLRDVDKLNKSKFEAPRFVKTKRARTSFNFNTSKKRKKFKFKARDLGKGVFDGGDVKDFGDDDANYKIKAGNDIVNDSDASIWEVIHFRYKKTAYPMLLEK
jgi:hypothetical protein